MTTMVRVYDKLHNTPAVLRLRRQDGRIQINEFELDPEDAWFFIKDLIDTVAAANMQRLEAALPGGAAPAPRPARFRATVVGGAL